MFTEKSGSLEEKQIDRIIYNQGPKHQDKLAEIAEKLKLKFDEEKLFSREADEEINQFAERPDMAAELEQLFETFRNRMSVMSSGHDKAHILDNLTSAMRIFKEYEAEGRSLTEGEKLEIILGIGGHDLSRYLEEGLDKMDKKDLSYLAPAMLFRDPKIKKAIKLPENFSLRLLYDIFSGSVPETKHKTADVIHQCDREQLIGSATIARGLGFDVCLSGRGLAIPLKKEFEKKLPMPESADDRYWLVQYEFFMRNIYNPVSPKGKEVWNQLKAENAIILMLGLEGKEEEYKQVFGPELGLIKQGEENVHWSKKPISEEAYENAKKEKEDFMSKLDFSEYQEEKLVELATHLMGTDHIEIPDNFREVLTEKLDKCNEQERKNFWMILKYSLDKRHGKRENDLSQLENKQGIEGVVSRWLKEELNSREEKYASDES